MLGTVTVVAPGVQTTVQDLPGRAGLWGVGVPPSGAWDDFSFALANLAVGNPPGAPGLEAVVTGPVLRFERNALVCITGAAHLPTVDGRAIRPGTVVAVRAGAVLDVGPCGAPGMRAYVAVAGGFAVPRVLGSRSTFLLGGFGGLDGRALAFGDELPLGRTENVAAPLDVEGLLPPVGSSWLLHVVPGPHGAPEHLTAAGVDALFDATWAVDHRADRTGVRLVGPAPVWARDDGGEAGLHPSNIHDSAYPVGAIMLSGDTPVIVGPDGPSLGGFVVPCAVVRADRWKLAQLRPGDTVQLVPVTPDEADRANAERAALLASPRAAAVVGAPRVRALSGHRPDPLLDVAVRGHTPAFTIRRAGDHHLLVEAGPRLLDLAVRMWIHLLAKALQDKDIPGIREIVEGVRSLLVAVDEAQLPLAVLAEELELLAAEVPDPQQVVLDVREVTLPIAFDHPAVHKAMARYTRSVRPDAPWSPDNVEFIRRVNALDARADVFDIVQAATYLVLGLGDVYLGAPVAVPIDPRHRLVTTKYDPARTWTPQNAVGIGGVYLCIYGMEGPGGYQLVGRTVPVWRLGGAEVPWLLRHFDRLRFRPVSADELAEMRAQVKSGRAELETRPARFSLAEVGAIEAEHAAEITTFLTRRNKAFADERARWGRP